MLFFAPYQFISFELAKIIQFILCSILFVHALIQLRKILAHYFDLNSKKHILISFLILPIAGVHLTREMHLLNINLIMIWLTITYLNLTISNKKISAAFCLSLLILFKPYFGILLLPLFIKKSFKIILFAFITSVILSLITIFIGGFEFFISLHKQWLMNMLGHQDNMFSEHTFSSIFTSYTGIKLMPSAQIFFIAFVVLVFIIFRIKSISKNTYDDKLFILDTLILLAIIPNLVITDSQHFLYSIPLIFYLLHELLVKKTGVFEWIIFSVLILFYGANSNDLLGNPLSDTFDRFSTIGLANLGIILMTIYYYQKSKKQFI